jgi:hypothetical protein
VIVGGGAATAAETNPANRDSTAMRIQAADIGGIPSIGGFLFSSIPRPRDKPGELGFDTFVFWPADEPPDQLERFAQEIVPALK